MKLKRYSSREQTIFVWVVLPYTFIINSLALGSCFYESAAGFLQPFIMGIFYFAIVYTVFGLVAFLIKKRYPEDSKLFRRIAVMLPLFFVMNVLTVQFFYLLYEAVQPGHCEPLREMQWWTTGFACLASMVLTFINEAAAGWDKWKASITETEQLKYAYQKTKLLGLKGQVNPHFLFNCFNTLSSLISEDQEAADAFLDEMTKVHRYMLRSDDEHLTPLSEELKFAGSYLYLIKARFGDAIKTETDVDEKFLGLLLPPLSLQVILENIIYNNIATKAAPLHIYIGSFEEQLLIQHTVHLKTKNDKSDDDEEGLDNLIKKYELLNNSQVTIKEIQKERIILLPLMHKKELYHEA